MFVIKAVYVYLCFHNVQCIFDDSSDGEVYNYDSSGKDSSENQVISNENQSKSNETDFENGNLNSTIETSVCKYQEIKIAEEVDEYRNKLGVYPYAASIQRKGSHYANGALVDKRWVMSSASEFYNVRESIKFFRVRLGSMDCKRGGTVLSIISVQVHPSFVRGKPNFDLALLRLAAPVTRTLSISPIALSKVKGTVVSAKFMSTYWPRIVVMGKVLPSSAKERVKFTNMRVSTQELIPSRKCSKVVENLSNSSLCLESIVLYHSVCMPDAGAPIVVKGELWGITSGWVSPACPSEPGPTVFTRVSTAIVRSWIDAQLT